MISIRIYKDIPLETSPKVVHKRSTSVILSRYEIMGERKIGALGIPYPEYTIKTLK